MQPLDPLKRLVHLIHPQPQEGKVLMLILMSHEVGAVFGLQAVQKNPWFLVLRKRQDPAGRCWKSNANSEAM